MMTRPVIKGGYTPEWGSVVGGLRTGQFVAAGGTTDEIISQLLYVSISGTFTGVVNLERFIGGAWTVVDTYTAPETVIFENPKALRMRLHCTAFSGGAITYAIEDVYVPPTAIQGDPGEDGEDGTNGINGTNGAPGSTGPAAAAGDAFHTSRNAITLANVPTLGSGGPKYLLATAYNDNNPMPLTAFKRRSGAPTDTTNPFYVLSTDGQWWEQMISGGDVFIEQFGGKADFDTSNPTLGTLNWQPLQWALAVEQLTPGYKRTPRVRFGFGKYKIEQQVMHRGVLSVVGTFSLTDGGESGYGTQLHFRKADGSQIDGSAFVFMTGNSGPTEHDGAFGTGIPGAGGSYIGGFSIHGAWDAVTEWDLSTIDVDVKFFHVAAVRIRAQGVFCDRIAIYSWKGHGFHIHGAIAAGSSYPLYGNVNEWHTYECFVHSASGHGWWIAGNDANAGMNYKCRVHFVGGAGIVEGAAFVNTHMQPQITGYGHRGVTKSGKRYMYTGIGNPTTTVPGTQNTTWYYCEDGGSNVIFLDWDTLTANQKKQFWLIKIPMSIINAQAVVVGPYVENSSTVTSHSITRAIYGGTSTWTSISAHILGIEYGFNFAGTSGPNVDANGAGFAYTKYGGAYADDWANGPRIFKTGRTRDGDYDFGYIGNDIYLAKLGGSVPFIMQITTPSTTEKFGGIGPVRDKVIFPNGIAIGNKIAGTLTNGGVFGVCSSGPPIDSGIYPLRSIWFNIDATAGQPVMYKVTTAGVIKDFDWISFSFGAGAIVKTSAGKFYLNETSHLSTIEPSHTSTSGPVDPGDGTSWTYLGNTAPVFKVAATAAA